MFISIILSLKIKYPYTAPNIYDKDTKGYTLDNGNNLINTILSAKNGDIIRVHAGTYSITKNITISSENIKIIGDDPFKTIIDASGNSGNLITTTKNNITIKNFTIN